MYMLVMLICISRCTRILENCKGYIEKYNLSPILLTWMFLLSVQWERPTGVPSFIWEKREAEPQLTITSDSCIRPQHQSGEYTM